ncbi:pentapeptide repeat-containing protein [Kribbella sp. C-35]|uniref:pentapeptide repeat-containing protein n=1 Tax=Kribbella sp. C-35 TaxID=2789276 RepID=UPI0039783402
MRNSWQERLVAGEAARRWTYGVVAVLVVGAVGFLLWLVLVVVPVMAYPSLDAADMRADGLRSKEIYDVQTARLQLQSGLRGTTLQGIVGLVALSGAVLAWRQYVQQRNEKRDDFHLDLYGQALSGLGSDQNSVRIAGLHGLARLAALSESYRKPCGDVLLAYIRDRRPLKEAPKDASAPATDLPSDVQTALTLLTAAPPAFFGLERLKLQELNMGGAHLVDAHLERADLSRTRLTDARMARARLGGADLTSAYALRADLTGADWDDAVLDDIELRGAVLTGEHGVPMRCRNASWPPDFNAPPCGDDLQSPAPAGDEGLRPVNLGAMGKSERDVHRP